MARRNRDHDEGLPLEAVRLGVIVILLLGLAVGGLGGLTQALQGVLALLAIGLVATVVIAAVVFCFRLASHSSPGIDIAAPAATTTTGPAKLWDTASVRSALTEIDWYQFEKFCAALLRADGYDVERKGGAHPDGGVDLIAEKAGERMLVQCKHWKTWLLQEKVVREMLGSMTHFAVGRGAVYTLKGWTAPARSFAALHGIELVDGAELSSRAVARLPQDLLGEILKTGVHHCPKCEAPMVLREGNFKAFWGCSRFPRCRGKLNHSGAR